MSDFDLPLPDIASGYRDPEGYINPTVYESAQKLWPQADSYARQMGLDSQSAQSLLMKAVAKVSSRLQRAPEAIDDLPSYLYRSFQNLVKADRRRAARRGEKEPEIKAALVSGKEPAESFHQGILEKQLIARMQPWMRQVYELLTLGYSFNEIGRELRSDPKVVRNRYNRNLRRLSEAIEKEQNQAQQRVRSSEARQDEGDGPEN